MPSAALKTMIQRAAFDVVTGALILSRARVRALAAEDAEEGRVSVCVRELFAELEIFFDGRGRVEEPRARGRVALRSVEPSPRRPCRVRGADLSKERRAELPELDATARSLAARERVSVQRAEVSRDAERLVRAATRARP